jgi:hypothetical protein
MSRLAVLLVGALLACSVVAHAERDGGQAATTTARDGGAVIVEAKDEAAPAVAPEQAPAPPAPGPASPPPPSASAGEHGQAPPPAPRDGFPVRIGDRKVFLIHVARGGMSAQGRAQKVSQALEQLVEEGRADDVRSEEKGGLAVVYVGTTPVVQLAPEDAAAAGDASLEVHAEAIATALRAALRTELRRRHIANVVFSLSLVVLFGLVSVLLQRAVSRGRQRINVALDSRELPGLRVGNVEVLTPAAVRVLVSTSVAIATPVVKIGIFLGWLLFSLSLFAGTAELGHRLTGFVVGPVTTLLGRFGSALPVIVLVGIGAFALLMLLRFLRIFFASVASGEITLYWVPPEHAVPVGIVVRMLTVIVGLLAAAPLVTGDDAGSIRIVGFALVGALALGATPALANAGLGLWIMFSGRIRIGDHVELGEQGGVVREISLFELHLADPTGVDVRLPHLLTLVRPLRVLGDVPAAAYEVTIEAKAAQGRVRKALASALHRQEKALHVELVELDADGARYRVIGAAAPGEEDLASAIADALTREGVSFSNIRKREPRA